VLYETQGIVPGVRIEELVAILGDVGEVTVLSSQSKVLLKKRSTSWVGGRDLGFRM